MMPTRPTMIPTPKNLRAVAAAGLRTMAATCKNSCRGPARIVDVDHTPSEGFAPSLVKGKTYQLTALRDVGLPTTSCLFVFGEPLGTAAPAPSPSGGAASGSFGATCTDSTGCSGAASYCALMPGRSSGYCTATGCKANPSVCPEKWGCLDLSSFQPGAPPICTKP